MLPKAVAFPLLCLLLLGIAIERSAQQVDNYGDEIYQIWNTINQTRPNYQLHIVYMSSSADYMEAVQAINYTYSMAASQLSAAQQTEISVQILPILIPPTFPFNYTEMLVVQLYNYNVDIIVGDNTWILEELAGIYQVPNVLLYYFPQMAPVSQVYSDFVIGFYLQTQQPDYAPFIALYDYLDQNAADQSVYSNYGNDYSSGNSGGSIQTTNPPYTYYPVNSANFTLPLITYNPFFVINNPILLNITVIIDAALPNQLDMQLFQVITSSTLSKSAAVGLYFLTIPVTVTQSQLDTYVLSLMPYPGPRFVYATAITAAGLLNSINRLGAFSTSFTSPIYQWTFFNLTGGPAYLPAFNLLVCAPYIYHWEIYNLTAANTYCPMACTNCSGNVYNRMIECDFGFYLNTVVQAYAAMAPTTSNKRSSIISALNYSADPSLFASGQHVFTWSYDYAWSRIGMSVSLYLGVNADNAAIMTNCSLPPFGDWNCTNVFNASAKSSSSPYTVQIAAYAAYPYYYINTTTGLHDGFYIALARLLSKQIGFTYNIYGISVSGNYNASSRSWTGVVGEVMDSADIGMAPMTPYANLTTTLAFSNPITQTCYSIVQQIPNPAVSFGDLFHLIFQPFNAENWIIQLASIVGVALLLTLFDYLSPNMVMFSIKRSWFYVFARSVMGAGGQSPDVFSSQILMLFWSFVTMITISTYTANLIALSIDSSTDLFASTLSDLLVAPLQPCFILGSSTATYFSTSSVPLEAAVWQAASSCLFTSGVQAFTALANWSDPNAAYYCLVTLQPTAMYVANMYDNLQVTVNYSQVNLILAVPNGLQAGVPIASINSALTQLTTAGNLTAIVNQYLRMPSAPFPATPWDQLSSAFNEDANALFNFQRMAGVFLIMVFGAVLSLVVAAIERGVAFGWKTMEARKRTAMENLIRNEVLSSRPRVPGDQNTSSSDETKTTTPSAGADVEDAKSKDMLTIN